MSIQFDELKVQERLRWDPRTNNILGVCREHAKVCALQFCSMNQAESIALALREKRIHLATEVRIYSVFPTFILMHLLPSGDRHRI